MKKTLLALILLSLPLRADDVTFEASRQDKVDAIKKIINDPKSSDKQLADAAIKASALLDEDTTLISGKNQAIIALGEKAYPSTDGSGSSPAVPAAPQPDATATQTASGSPLKAGINITNEDARLMRHDGDYDYVSWKVTLFNNTDHDMDDIFVTFSFRDDGDFEVKKDVADHQIVKAHSSANVVGQEMMKNGDWDKVKSYSVSTD